MIVTIKGDKAIELSKIKKPKLVGVTSAHVDGVNIAQLNIVEKIVIRGAGGDKKEK